MGEMGALLTVRRGLVSCMNSFVTSRSRSSVSVMYRYFLSLTSRESAFLYHTYCRVPKASVPDLFHLFSFIFPFVYIPIGLIPFSLDISTMDPWRLGIPPHTKSSSLMKSLCIHDSTTASLPPSLPRVLHNTRLGKIRRLHASRLSKIRG